MTTNQSPWKRTLPLGVFLFTFLMLQLCTVVLSQGTNCNADEWMCRDGNCTYSGYVCDGEGDCPDSSDEDIGVCATWSCTEDHYVCEANRAASTPPLCISIYYVCDGEDDCLDGQDEDPDPSCEDFFWRIFGIATTTLPSCSADQFWCNADYRCIPDVLRCDTKYDCSDGADEDGCVYRNCTESEFTCHSKQCVNMTLICNDVPDCKDGTDEILDICLEGPECGPDQFQCLNGQKCVSLLDDMCDGTQDCPDNSDETVCDLIGLNECQNRTLNDCSQQCRDLLFGYECACNDSFVLKEDGKTCEEVNLCLEEIGVCSQICHHRPGGYSCECAEGYIPTDPERINCRHNSTVEPYLIFGNKYFIQRMNMDGTNVRSLSDEHVYTHVLDYDLYDHWIYYADAPGLHQSLMRMNINGGSKELINSVDAVGVEGIAYEWITKKLYWTSNRLRGIYVSEADGTSVKVLLKDESKLPRAICVYPRTGHMFWSDWDLEPFIARMGLDGSNKNKVVTENLFWPNGLTIDYASDKIWWADANLDVIEYANFDGSGRHTVLVDLPHPYALSVFEDSVYWTEWNLLQVERANRWEQQGQRQTILKTNHMPYDIHVVHPLRQPLSPNPCAPDNGGCSHLCLMTPGTNDTGRPNAVCACPEGYTLQSNQRTCIHECGEGQYLCPAPDDKCIPQRLVCDKKRDCRGGEDERNCTPNACLSGYFKCANTSQCLPSWRVCDQTPHCRDDSDESNATCVNMQCLSYEFRCNSGQCIPLGWVCDGDNDCADRSDEQPIHEECRKCDDVDEFKCDNNKCIPRLWVCDWDDDCGDMSDEPRDQCYANRSALGCPPAWKRCETNYRCVPDTNFCDGNDDCRDGSDEFPRNCPKCPQGDFECRNGTPSCIPKRWLCDFRNDCQDGSDEDSDYCDGKYRACEEDVEFECSNKKCIRKMRQCDGVNDCQDIIGGSDEQGCAPPTCFSFEFTCENGDCIPQDLVCDGSINCADVSDETTCPTRYPGGRHCRDDQFQCDNTACIPFSYVCDGDNDCFDNSDERRDSCDHVPCSSDNSFRCNSTRRCLPSYLRCDGNADCADGSDEYNCMDIGCSNIHFTCKNGKCLRPLQVCDGRNDCGDSSDEIACRVGYCTNSSCEHDCINITGAGTPVHKCECKSGYTHTPGSTRQCSDVDECASAKLNNCPQVCKNGDGSYSCECLGGFVDGGFGRSCSPRDDYKMMLSVGHEIQQYSIRPQRELPVVLAQRRVDAIDFDIDNQLIYWSDTASKRIYRSAIPTNNRELGVPQDLGIEVQGSVFDIAYDWMAGNIYLAESIPGQSKILVAKGNWSYTTTIVTMESTVVANSVAVNPIRGLMYWTEMNMIGASGAIRVGTMSGHGQSRKMISGDVWDPVSLSVDFAMRGRLFWIDRRKNTIESAEFDGTDHYVVKEVQYPIQLDVFGDKLFYTQKNDRQVLSLDKFGRGNPTAVISANVYVAELRVVNPQMFQTGNANATVVNRCADMVCTGICLLEESGARCVCPDSWPQVNSQCYQPSELEYLLIPEVCSCRNQGRCVLAGSQPTCSCQQGFRGTNCQEIVPVPTTTTTTTSTASPRTSTHSMTSPRGPNTAASTSDNSHKYFVAAIVAPVIIAVVILGLVALVAYWLYKRGQLGKRVSGQGEVRPGSARRPRGTPHDHIADEAIAYENGTQLERAVTFDDGMVRFSNPTYDAPPAKRKSSDAPSADQDVNTNYVYRPAEPAARNEPPSIAEAVAGLTEIKLDLKEQ